MRARRLSMVLVAAALLGGCTDYAEQAEGMIEAALGGVDCKILSIHEATEDIGKIRRRTLTVVYRPCERLYHKTMLGDKEVVQTLVKGDAQLIATLRFERGRGASDPTVLSLAKDADLSEQLKASSAAGIFFERDLADLRGKCLMEGTPAYAEQVALVREQEAAAAAKAEAERKALAAKRAQEESERKARAEAEAILKAREAEPLTRRLRACFAEAGYTTILTAVEILSKEGNVTTFRCYANEPICVMEDTGTFWREADGLKINLPRVGIMRLLLAPGTVYTATFTEGPYDSWVCASVDYPNAIFPSTVNRKKSYSYVKEYDLLLEKDSPACREFFDCVNRMVALARKIHLDEALIKDIDVKIVMAERASDAGAAARLRDLKAERKRVMERIQSNQKWVNGDTFDHYGNAFDPYLKHQNKLLSEAIGIPLDFGEL